MPSDYEVPFCYTFVLYINPHELNLIGSAGVALQIAVENCSVYNTWTQWDLQVHLKE